jgi:hypothetical protein
MKRNCNGPGTEDSIVPPADTRGNARSICWLLVAGCWLLVAGCWLLVAGCWSLLEPYSATMMGFVVPLTVITLVVNSIHRPE